MQEIFWPQKPIGPRPVWEGYLDQLRSLAIDEKRNQVRQLYVDNHNQVRFSLHFWDKPKLV